ncbi:hypothetical protein [Clostridioides difficile]|uniref:hypothetical protein n=1 Tax=Clostridioides difficile TaxID=1496 RepID=UPI00038DA0F2|nr:hypothetical protein [Clostridioides difficile]EQG12151.1 sensor histidine kinase domain protein [Clostridioides difficile 6042]
MKNQSLITQFRHTFIFIIIASIVATVITYVFALYLYIHSLNKDIYPPNYYERQVPRIEKYINEKNIALLSQSNEEGSSDLKERFVGMICYIKLWIIMAIFYMVLTPKNYLKQKKNYLIILSIKLFVKVVISILFQSKGIMERLRVLLFYSTK